MSSPPEGKLETKAGHPPAVKAGGMRIVQKHPHSGDTKEEKDKDDQGWESPSPPKPTVFISGVIARVRAFPPNPRCAVGLLLSLLDPIRSSVGAQRPLVQRLCRVRGALPRRALCGEHCQQGSHRGAGAACPPPSSCSPSLSTQPGSAAPQRNKT
ncbi:death-associated protein 1 isoform X1 [Panthera uncia]|uniref:death-associated protein 1 isoform X1 n=1 Tax=Panthera uncia TaxID=29064 RepID=UPI0020FFB783|nr:death-associated protein 1 isoform X1 [Panthera uncia]